MWMCGECDTWYQDETPAYGWICEPYCGPCFRAMEPMSEAEPCLQQVAECERLVVEASK